MVFLKAAAGVLGLAAVLGPLALGATFPWPRFGLEAAMTLAVLAWACAGPRRWRSVLPALAVSAVALVQLVPLPDRLLLGLAPLSAGAWKVAGMGLPAAWHPISVDPAATAAAARRLLLGVATIAAVADVAKLPPLRNWLFGSIALSGLAILGLGVVSPSNPEDRTMLWVIDLSGPIMSWKTPVHAPVQTAGVAESDVVTVAGRRYVSDAWIVGDRIGPYIISNHYSGALCLTLPFLLAGWLAAARPRWLAVRWGGVAILAVAALWTSAVVGKSRAGSAALALTLLTLVALGSQARWARRGAGVLAGACGAAIAVFAVCLSFQWKWPLAVTPTALQPVVAGLLANARFMAAHVGGRMFMAAPLFGTGLATFGAVYPQMHPDGVPMHYAHNDYAQWLAETGLIGTAAALIFGGMLLRSAGRFVRQPATLDRAINAAPWAALAGIAAHSPFDWNLHVPANAFLAVLAAGMGLATGDDRSAPPPNVTRKPASRLPGFVLAVACVGALALLARDAWSETVQRTLRDAVAAARLSASDVSRPAATPVLKAALALGDTAARWDPANAQIHLLLGQIELHLADAAATSHAADERLALADERFREARRRCAACRGLPEPLPPAKAGALPQR